MSRFLDKRLLSLDAYVPGEQPKRGAFIKLNTNEFPYPPAPGVPESVKNSVDDVNLYCDLTCKDLKAEFSKVFGYGGENVIFTNGSDEALYLCFLAFCGSETGVAFADITYGFYTVYAELCGIDQLQIPLDSDFRIVPEDYYNLNRTIFIANPNAPTGLSLSVSQVEAILKKNPDNVMVIDEAYAAFSRVTCADLIKKYDNLVVVGTFSKSRGLAGARLGYIITNTELARDLETIKYSINPYNVNTLTQSAGTAVLRENDYYEKCISEIIDTRDRFTKELIELGFEVIPSKSNFVFAKNDKISGALLASKLREEGILIRRFDKERIKEYVRISIGTPTQMSEVINKIQKILGGIQ